MANSNQLPVLKKLSLRIVDYGKQSTLKERPVRMTGIQRIEIISCFPVKIVTSITLSCILFLVEDSTEIFSLTKLGLKCHHDCVNYYKLFSSHINEA